MLSTMAFRPAGPPPAVPVLEPGSFSWTTARRLILLEDAVRKGVEYAVKVGEAAEKKAKDAEKRAEDAEMVAEEAKNMAVEEANKRRRLEGRVMELANYMTTRHRAQPPADHCGDSAEVKRRRLAAILETVEEAEEDEDD